MFIRCLKSRVRERVDTPRTSCNVSVARRKLELYIRIGARQVVFVSLGARRVDSFFLALIDNFVPSSVANWRLATTYIRLRSLSSIDAALHALLYTSLQLCAMLFLVTRATIR